MRQFSLDHYAEALDRQVVHMDQGACYCPEFRSTHSMQDYPSRKLQLARAVHKGELTASESVGSILLRSILSRQGERWQCFGESPEEYTDCMLLSRELMLKNGVNTGAAERLQRVLGSQEGHILDIAQSCETWQNAFDTAFGGSQGLGEANNTALFLDDATCMYASDTAPALAQFLLGKKQGLRRELEVFYDGWELFVYGLIDEGIAHARSLISGLQKAGVTRLITLSGRSEYLFQVFYPKLGLTHDIECISVLDMASRLRIERPSYLYAGSFRTRYLGQSDKINVLVPNEQEYQHPMSEESEPLLKAPGRVNKVTLRQKPICAEHLLFEFPESCTRAIFEDAVEYIQLSQAEQVVVMEPWAYHELKYRTPRLDPVYYLQRLD